MRVGYARCASRKTDIRQQTAALQGRGCDRIYIDQGLAASRRERPELESALATCGAGSTLVVTKLARIALSISDALALATRLRDQGARLELDGTVYDWSTPAGRSFLAALGVLAEFQATLARACISDGIEIARGKGRPPGRRPKLTPQQCNELLELWQSGQYTDTELGEHFHVARTTITRTLERMAHQAIEPS